MWIYYYVSKPRVAQLVQQLAPKVPAERIKKWSVKAGAKAAGDAETSALLRILGKAKIGGGVEGDVQRATEEKFTATDHDILEAVRKHLLKSRAYALLDDSARVATLPTRSLVLFRGDFRPSLEGNAAERLATYFDNKFIEWKGTCGEVPVVFVTSRSSIISSTPIATSLSTMRKSQRLDGFATLLVDGRKQQKTVPLALVPLFFGRELDSEGAS